MNFLLSGSFFTTSLPENILEDSVVCQKCMNKINKYDEFITRANQIKDELINEIKTSQNAKEACTESQTFQTFDENFQLIENFPEIDFDFVISSEQETKIDEVQNSEDFSEGSTKIIEKKEAKCDGKYFEDNEIYDHENEVESSNFVEVLSEPTEFKSQKNIKTCSKFHEKRKYHCETCQVSFKTENSLKIHISSGHGSITKNIPCVIETCRKMFKDKAALRAHLICHKKHEKDPAFFCDQCGKGFFYKLSFTQHLKIHSGVRDKECEICGFKAFSTTHLQRHIRARHTKEKNHICTFCGRAFSERYNMMSHMKKQHIEKKSSEKSFFKCMFCEMEYSEDLKLKVHLEASHKIFEA